MYIYLPVQSRQDTRSVDIQHIKIGLNKTKCQKSCGDSNPG